MIALQPRKPIAASGFYGKPSITEITKTKPPPVGLSGGGVSKKVEARYNSTAEGAIIMTRPSKEHAVKYNRKGLEVVDVVVHPELGQCLRPHQVEGLKFMYECVMGMRKTDGMGCILADEVCHSRREPHCAIGAID